MNSVGKFLGNLAYPIFLTHWLVAIAVVGSGIPFEANFVSILPVLIGIHLLAIAMRYFMEKPINYMLHAAR